MVNCGRAFGKRIVQPYERIDLLRGAGVEFAAVVGHSSGEIAAAYAAGFIAASDAIRIAYYRGLYAQLAHGRQGRRGAMLAVGTSWEDAKQLIELPKLEGRLSLAAGNSAASVTLSGDEDAIAHAQLVFEDEKKFARQLKVDTAYHSHHMLPCSDQHIKSLRACNIGINRSIKELCLWYSSMYDGKPMGAVDELRDIYWRDNMVSPVLFEKAMASALSAGFTIALEIGPHPALKGPATQVLSDLTKESIAYSGVLSRNTDNIEALADGFGFLWTQLGVPTIDFSSFNKLMSGMPLSKPLRGLPSYQWDHSRIHWHESRISKNIRARSESFHELLGVISPNLADKELRWKNLLKVDEISWLNGHQLQGQTVFPAAGYVAMALEAARHLANEREVELFEVYDLNIGRAITFEDDSNFAVETLVSLTGI